MGQGQWKGHALRRADPHQLSAEPESSPSREPSAPDDLPESPALMEGPAPGRPYAMSAPPAALSAETAQAPKKMVTSSVTNTTSTKVMGIPLIQASLDEYRHSYSDPQLQHCQGTRPERDTGWDTLTFP